MQATVRARPRRLEVAIVGGGPAGLMAAHTLKRLGCERVAVFERGPEVGGKVRSIMVGGRPYELGACLVSDSDRTVLALAAEHRQELRPGPLRAVADVANGGGVRSFGRYLRDQHGACESLLALRRYSRLIRRHAGLYGHGLTGASPELFRPFDELQRELGIEPAARLIRPIYSALGYGYLEETPALYVLKFVDRSQLRTVVRSALGRRDPWPQLFTRGFERLWRDVARGLDVRTEAEVVRIERGGEGGLEPVRLLLADGTEHEADSLILATPPAAIANALEVIAQEVWRDYCPHAPSEALADGFVDRFAALQGKRRTWYVGGYLAFETVEHAAAQAAATVGRAFAPAGASI